MNQELTIRENSRIVSTLHYVMSQLLRQNDNKPYKPRAARLQNCICFQILIRIWKLSVKVAMLRLVTRVMPMMVQTSMAQTLAASQLRTIYSESFLGIDFLRTKRAKEKLAIAEPGKFLQKMRSEYNENGIGNISDGDLLREATQ